MAPDDARTLIAAAEGPLTSPTAKVSPPAADAPKPGLVQSVDRALVILEMLAAQGDLGVTEMAKTLDVHKSTVSRLVATLEEHGLVEQLSDRGRYQLSLGVVRLAGATRGRLDLVTESRALSRTLAVQTGETVNLVVLSGRETLYLDQASSGSALQIHNWLGKRNPMHATANGRVLLAWLPEADIDRIIADITGPGGDLAPLTAKTITDPVELRNSLLAVREQGYSIVADELELGLTAVAAPIRGMGGTVIASLSVSGPSFRLTGDRLDATTRALLAAASDVSARMSYHAFMGEN
ncbi:MAG TPA: IclR family transcriptional regulator [Microbacteriaceae bacterium]|nr:IclR family transcriptional regulator [Microbacteriaceae bacterium]